LLNYWGCLSNWHPCSRLRPVDYAGQAGAPLIGNAVILLNGRINMEPKLNIDKNIIEIAKELKKREPIFHYPEFGTKRKDFERMTEETFWEVGASGNRYSRKFVLDTLERRFKNPPKEELEIKDFHCFKISENNYLVTYTLIQEKVRITRRSTIWRKRRKQWKIVYHQGTIVEYK